MSVDIFVQDEEIEVGAQSEQIANDVEQSVVIIKGADGKDGQNGKDGISPVVSVSAITGGHRITITDANGTKTVDVMDGVDGQDGSPGQNGQDGSDGVGIASIKQTTTSTADGGNNVFTVTLTNGTSATFTVKNGSKGSTGATGAAGKDGKDGLDATPVTPLFANSIEECTDPTKFYVLPDGYIYASQYYEETATVIPYTNLAGAVQENTRMNSSGVAKALTGAITTGFVPVKQGDKVRVKGFNPKAMPDSNYPYIAFYTAASESAIVASDKIARGDGCWVLNGDVYEWTAFTMHTNAQHSLASTITHIRICGNMTGTGSDVIVTVNEEIGDPVTTTVSGYKWQNTGHAFIPADYEDRIIALEQYAGISDGNLLKYATDADRTTIYNGKGYKTGTRLSSSGSEGSYDNACASGYIPAKVGDVLRIKNIEATSEYGWYVIAYDANNTKTGSVIIVGDELDVRYYLTVSELATDGVVLDEATFGSHFNAIRFSAITISDNTIVTINEYEETESKKWGGKKWVVVGDSLTQALNSDGTNANTDKYYHTHIAEETGITVVNMGQGGTGYKKTDDSGYAFYQRIVNIPTDADVITIMGSINDLSRTADYTIGEPTDTGTETICGCINTTLDTLFNICPTANLGIITPVPNDYYNYFNFETDTRTQRITEYCEKLTEICHRRSIPVLDMFHGSGMRPWDENFKTAVMPDGTHANEAGHKIMATKIRAFLETLL